MREQTVSKLNESDVIKDYLNGLSLDELGKKYGFGSETIRQHLIANNIPRRGARKRRSLRPIPPVGKSFGQWTVISEEAKSGREVIEGSKSRSLYWLCKCTCGNVSWKHAKDLQEGRAHACRSCSKKSYLTEDGMIEINTVLLHKYTQTKTNIPTRKNRGRRDPLTFNISIDDITNLYESQNHVCALSGISIEPEITKTLTEQNLSIDRIDSFKGYEPDNIQLVDKRINMMKGSLSNEEFIWLCKKVAENNV